MPTFIEIFTPIISAITAAFGWFEKLGIWGGVITGMVVMFLFSRLLLAPLFGASPTYRFKHTGSDAARKVRNFDES